MKKIVKAVATVAVAAVAVTAIVATAGAAGAAVGVAAGMYLGVSSATAVTISTVATAGGYALAGAIGATALSDAGEELTGTNVIRDKLMGGNQDLYNTVEAGLYTVGMGYTNLGASNSGLSSGKNNSSNTTTISRSNPAHNAAQYEKLKTFYRYCDKYGKDCVKDMSNGKYRFYGKITPARNPGEMMGRRYVREWDYINQKTRGWNETLDHSGKIRQVRPDVSITGGNKVHYRFDKSGTYQGKW